MVRRLRKRRGWRLWIRRICIAVAVAILISAALVLPLRWVDPPTTAFMLRDDSGRVPVLYDWTDWNTIGANPPLAIVASEDQKFAAHFGFDVQSIVDSLEKSNNGKPLRGASTITQQVAKNLFLWSGRSFLRKGFEAYFTLLLELSLPKKRILEIYLNIAELGPGIYGVPAASEFYFGKDPSKLSTREAALLAAVLPNPNRLRVDRPSPYVRERQTWIVSQMNRLKREQWILRLE